MRLPGSTAKREFADFTAAVADNLVRAAFLMVADLGEAEDLVQETLLRTARQWHRVRSMDQPLAYARRILVNLVIDGQAGRARRRTELADRSEPALRARPDLAAAARFGATEERLDLIAALTTLTPRQRAVLVLRYWADLPEAEVARLLDCSAGTVKSTASRSLARLRDLMTSQNSPSVPISMRSESPW
jgi:RNA polymerase sigma-70 factor (sigma-E family)